MGQFPSCGLLLTVPKEDFMSSNKRQISIVCGGNNFCFIFLADPQDPINLSPSRSEGLRAPSTRILELPEE